jgi:hypothetical protein
MRAGAPLRSLAKNMAAERAAPPGGYIDAVAFELLPLALATERTAAGSVRTRAAVRLYTSVSRDNGYSLGLHITV